MVVKNRGTVDTVVVVCSTMLVWMWRCGWWKDYHNIWKRTPLQIWCETLHVLLLCIHTFSWLSAAGICGGHLLWCLTQVSLGVCSVGASSVSKSYSWNAKTKMKNDTITVTFLHKTRRNDPLWLLSRGGCWLLCQAGGIARLFPFGGCFWSVEVIFCLNSVLTKEGLLWIHDFCDGPYLL